MEKFLVKEDIENAINLDPMNDEIPQLDVLEAQNIMNKVANFAGNDTFASISLAMLYGYKVGFLKGRLIFDD